MHFLCSISTLFKSVNFGLSIECVPPLRFWLLTFEPGTKKKKYIFCLRDIRIEWLKMITVTEFEDTAAKDVAPTLQSGIEGGW